jgi:hypothetical protein
LIAPVKPKTLELPTVFVSVVELVIVGATVMEFANVTLPIAVTGPVVLAEIVMGSDPKVAAVTAAGVVAAESVTVFPNVTLVMGNATLFESVTWLDPALTDDTKVPAGMAPAKVLVAAMPGTMPVVDAS